jgi:hypothetical protein
LIAEPWRAERHRPYVQELAAFKSLLAASDGAYRKIDSIGREVRYSIRGVDHEVYAWMPPLEGLKSWNKPRAYEELGSTYSQSVGAILHSKPSRGRTDSLE